jgi:hypothetical protein
VGRHAGPRPRLSPRSWSPRLDSRELENSSWLLPGDGDTEAISGRHGAEAPSMRTGVRASTPETWRSDLANTVCVTRQPAERHPSSLGTAGRHVGCGKSGDHGSPRPMGLFHVKQHRCRVAKNEPGARDPCHQEARCSGNPCQHTTHLDGGHDELSSPFHVKPGPRHFDGHPLATGTTTARAPSLAPAATHARVHAHVRAHGLAPASHPVPPTAIARRRPHGHRGALTRPETPWSA